MSNVGRFLLLKLLAQVDRGGRDTLPIGERSAREYFAANDLAGRDAIHAYLENAQADGGVTLEWGRRAAAQDLQRIRIKDPDVIPFQRLFRRFFKSSKTKIKHLSQTAG